VSLTRSYFLPGRGSSAILGVSVPTKAQRHLRTREADGHARSRVVRGSSGYGSHRLNYSAEFLIGFCRTRVRIRLCEESLVELILKRDVVCPAHHCPGFRVSRAGVGA